MLDEREGFGLPLAEALAYGTPVVCTDLPTYREQIERLDAFPFAQIVPVGDPVALADDCLLWILPQQELLPQRLTPLRLLGQLQVPSRSRTRTLPASMCMPTNTGWPCRRNRRR